MFSLLIFMFCFFLGSIAMFFYSLKKRESQFRSLTEENAQLRVLLRATESRLGNIEKYLGQYSEVDSHDLCKESAEDAREEGADVERKGAEHDPLLHLSFEDPEKMERGSGDPNLELLMDTSDERKQE